MIYVNSIKIARYIFVKLKISGNHFLVENLNRKYSRNVSAADISFVLVTKENTTYYPLSDPVSTWKDIIDRNGTQFVLFVTGYLTTPNITTNEAAIAMSKAYLCRGNVTFILLDVGSYLDTEYFWAAYNTVAIGTLVGKALASLISYINLADIHLIGFGMGAQICASAGRTFSDQTFQQLPRITGLDPSNVCFKEGSVLSTLEKGDASYVDIIHTSPDALGISKSVGNVDFYPGTDSLYQPGCITLTCSHSRAWKYYAESVYPGHEFDFLSKRCSSRTSFLTNLCVSPWVPMGYATSIFEKGMYYLSVNSQSPYGKNATESVSCKNSTGSGS